MATTKFNVESKLKFHKIVKIQANGEMAVTFIALWRK